MKKFLAVLASAALAAVMLFCGCTPADGRDGRDGKDGQDISVTQLYEAAKSLPGNENLTLEDFLREYLSYNDDALRQELSFKTAVNKSLMCGVSILTRFAYSSKAGGALGVLPSARTYQVYTGSGVIIWLDKPAGDAYVVTNCHVVYDDTSITPYCDDIRLYLYGQDTSGVNYVVDSSANISGDENYRIKADIAGVSKNYDLALLKVSGSEVLKRSDAMSAEFADNVDAYAGETVYAIGNASGEGMSATDGIISKDSEYISLTLSEKDNPLDSDYISYRVMRTTAPINHGNSGGAMYNTKGEIIGIVNAKDEGEDIDNMGYVLPVNNVRRIIGLMRDNFETNGYTGPGVKKAYMNIQTQVTDSYSRYNAQTGLAEIYETIRVVDVLGEPALGKLYKDDIIREVKITSGNTVKDSIKVTRNYQISEFLFSARRGDTVVIKVERGGTELEVSIPLDSDKCFNLIA